MAGRESLMVAAKLAAAKQAITELPVAVRRLPDDAEGRVRARAIEKAKACVSYCFRFDSRD
jgi:hypothetical protein